MTEGVAQIFISYARDDDVGPPDQAGAKGFVEFLHDQLAYEFQAHGKWRPQLWRDKRRVSDGDPFDAEIQDALRHSSILLVVLSNNWLASDYCRLELKLFAERWHHEGELALRRRIIIIGKRHVDRDILPSLLQNQVGFLFYTASNSDDFGLSHEFFSRGKVRDERYYAKLQEAAGHLLRVAGRIPTTPAEPPHCAVEILSSQPVNGRTVYVAKPANDTREQYDRVVKELGQRGFAVVPDVSCEIPPDLSATDFIDANIAKAECSVHLLGTKGGFAPEDAPQIVPLQLQRAALRAGEGTGTGSAAATFRRIVWAPKIFGIIGETPGLEAERDPLGVLATFDAQLATDKVTGDGLSQFVMFLAQHLVRVAPPLAGERVRVDRASDEAPIIYINHAPVDTEYANRLAKRLTDREMDVTLCAFEGSEAELRAFHRESLRECHAVTLCWAGASEVSVRTMANELRDWHALGRTRPFIYKGVVAGPPPGSRKQSLEQLFPPRKMDVIVDASVTGELTPEMLDKLVLKSAPAAP